MITFATLNPPNISLYSTKGKKLSKFIYVMPSHVGMSTASYAAPVHVLEGVKLM